MNSVENWATEFDLICKPRYLVGLMGTVYLLGFAAGSLVFGNLVDIIGRRKSLLGSCAVTPVVQFVWLCHPALNLTTIYIGALLLGLAASMRSTSTFLYALESMWIRSERVQYGTLLYAAEGFGVALVSLLFWARVLTWRSYCMANCVAMVSTMAFIYLRLPESPAFLFERCRFEELKACLVKISFTNGCHSPEIIEHGMRKLTQ